MSESTPKTEAVEDNASSSQKRSSFMRSTMGYPSLKVDLKPDEHKNEVMR